MTSVHLANLGVWRTVWTSAITPVDANLAKQIFQNKKIEKQVGKIFPFYFSKLQIAKEKDVLGEEKNSAKCS